MNRLVCLTDTTNQLDFLRIERCVNKTVQANAIVVFITISVCLTANTAYGASEFLLQNAANKKYANFSSCLKSSDNLFTLCIDELKEFISAENKYIKVKKTDESKTRLRKIVNYVKQSTDIYIQKSEKTNDIEDYNRATIAATLLTKLSPKFKTEYSSFLDKSTARRQGNNISLGLSSYFKTVKRKEPELQVVQKLIDNAFPVYDSLDANLRSSLDRFFDAFINRYYDYLVDIKNAIESKNIPEVTKLKYRHQAYTAITKIHQVNDRTNDINQIKQEIADTLDQHFKNLKNQTDHLNKRFVSGNDLDGVEVKMQVEYINYFFDMAPIIAQNRFLGFSKVREFPQSDLDDFARHRDFYPQSLNIQRLVNSNSYSDALTKGYASMNDAYQDSLSNEVVRRINLNANSAINYYQKVFRKDKLESLSLLLTLPTKYFSTVSREKRISVLDQFVTLIFEDIDDHVDKENHTTAFETLTKLRRLPAYLDRYQKLHQEKKLSVLDDYAETLFHKVGNLIKNDDYDSAFKHLKFAENVSGYLKRYKVKHEKIIENARRLADGYWLNRIIQVVESESISSAINIINAKMYASDKKKLAAGKIVDFARNEFSNLLEKLGYQGFAIELKSLQASDSVTDTKVKTLKKVISRTYQGWVVDEIKTGKLVSAARHIFEPGNGLSVDMQDELTVDLLDVVNVGSKKNPESMLRVLETMGDINAIPTEIKINIDDLAREIVHSWSMNVAKNGILNCKDWNVLSIGLAARVGLEYVNSPPIGGTKEKGKYYRWPCEIVAVYSSKNLACATGQAFFLVDGIEQSFPNEIQQDGIYWVMGEYNQNKKNALNRLVPVLENTYMSSCF